MELSRSTTNLGDRSKRGLIQIGFPALNSGRLQGLGGIDCVVSNSAFTGTAVTIPLPVGEL